MDSKERSGVSIAHCANVGVGMVWSLKKRWPVFSVENTGQKRLFLQTKLREECFVRSSILAFEVLQVLASVCHHLEEATT